MKITFAKYLSYDYCYYCGGNEAEICQLIELILHAKFHIFHTNLILEFTPNDTRGDDKLGVKQQLDSSQTGWVVC